MNQWRAFPERIDQRPTYTRTRATHAGFNFEARARTRATSAPCGEGGGRFGWERSHGYGEVLALDARRIRQLLFNCF